MPTKYRDEDDEQDDASARDWEAPDEADVDDEEDDGPETVPCPFCRRPVSELADLCPHCGNFVTGGDAPRQRSWWVVAVVLACVAAIVLVWVL